MAYLTIRIKNQDGYSQQDLTDERTVVGRSEDCGVCIKHESVSRQHCAFVRVGDECWLRTSAAPTAPGLATIRSAADRL